MRISQRGVARRPDSVRFTFEGESISACSGESIAAALLSANHRLCRVTRDGTARGVFCGMGVCGECSVLVNGRPVRACMEKVADGLEVQRQPALRTLPEGDHALAEDAMAQTPSEPPGNTRNVELLVIGAGPAGLAAARAAALRGAQVLLVDERAQPGGQYFKQPGAGFAIDESRLDKQFREGLALYQSALDAGVDFCFGTTVWGAFAGPQIAVATPGGSEVINAQRVVVSPGAYERPVPFPGWTLPGIMTTGAAQTLLRAYQTAPGKRVLVAGNGPLNLQVARELTAAGVTVVAVVELSPRPGLRQALDVLRMGLSSPGLVLSGAGHMAALLAAQVPLFFGHSVCEARGGDHVESVSIAKVDAQGLPREETRQEFAVDAVCLGYGFLGQSEIARALGAGHSGKNQWEEIPGDRDEFGRSSSAPEVFVVGDARGLGGSRIAQTHGALCGAEAAGDLGYHGAPWQRGALRKIRVALRRHRRFQKALWSVYAAPTAKLALANSATIICRCESVTRGQVEAVLTQGVGSIGAVKRETRAGMGRCQGRYCAGLLSALVPSSGESPNEAQRFFAPRPPFKPVSIADLASPYNAGVAFDRAAGAKKNTVAEPSSPSEHREPADEP